MKSIAIVGLGYIGLPTALVAASHNLNVFGFDIDQKKIDTINTGICPIVEPGLPELLSTVRAKNSFSASTILPSADYFIIAVPTPFMKDKKPDLSYVFEAGKTVAKKLNRGNTVILESTCPVGSTQQLKTLLEEHSGLKAGKDFYLAYCPERVLPGRIIHELVTNDRIIGGIDKTSAEKAKTFYKTFVVGNCFLTNDTTAEMVKLIENSSRDIQIALANQIAHMCSLVGINPFEVISLANKHPRVSLLQPGCGVGGHCIAVDPWFLVDSFPEASALLKTAREINDNKPHFVVNEVLSLAKKFRRKPNVLALGLTFKPNIDDLRESPALFIAKELSKSDTLRLTVYDPFVDEEKITAMGLVKEFSLETADIILILVKHSAFTTIDRTVIQNKIIIDPCGLLYEGDHGTALFGKGKCQEDNRPNTSP